MFGEKKYDQDGYCIHSFTRKPKNIQLHIVFKIDNNNNKLSKRKNDLYTITITSCQR